MSRLLRKRSLANGGLRTRPCDTPPSTKDKVGQLARTTHEPDLRMACNLRDKPIATRALRQRKEVFFEVVVEDLSLTRHRCFDGLSIVENALA